MQVLTALLRVFLFCFEFVFTFNKVPRIKPCRTPFTVPFVFLLLISLPQAASSETGQGWVWRPLYGFQEILIDYESAEAACRWGSDLTTTQGKPEWGTALLEEVVDYDARPNQKECRGHWSADAFLCSPNRQPLFCVWGYVVKKSICFAGYKLVNGICEPATPRKNLGNSSCNKGETTVGNPVNVGTGNKFQQEVDYVGTGPFPLYFVRSYNSQQNSGGTVGYNWRPSYGGSLDQVDSTTVVAYRSDGKGVTFKLINNAWVADTDVTDRLQQTPSGWIYRTADDSAETFLATGDSDSVTNRAGFTQTYTFSTGTDGNVYLDANGNPTTTPLPAGRLLRVRDSAGRLIRFGYDFSTRIVKMTDPEGQSYLYKYDANNNLSSVTYPDGKTKTYLYGEAAYTSGANLPHALTGIIDENGTRYATYRYDAQGRANDEDHGGAVDHYNLAYNTDPSGNPISTVVTDPLGTQRTYNFQTILGVVKSTGSTQPGGSGCAAASSAMTYDANGNVATRTDFNGNTTTYQYDLTRNLETSRTEAVGKTEARTITTTWHPTYRLPTQITEPGRVTDLVYDATTGNLLSRKVTATATGLTRQSTYTYTTAADGTLPALLKTVDGPRTDVADITSNSYYPNGDLKTITNALGHVTQITSYDAHGRPLTMVDANAVITTLSYTPRGWLKSRSIAGRTTRYDYDGVGQVIKVTLADNSTVTYTYDAAQRLTDITDTLLNRTHYTLDAIGNRVKEEVFDANNLLTTSKSRVFDALNRLWQEIGALNQTTRYAYDPNGNLTGITDPLNRTTTNTYDALNRLSQTTDALNGVTKYGYDPLDQLRSLTDPRNLVTGYNTNALGDETRLTSPDSGTTNRSFDTAGNLKTATDARGVTATLNYDALNRITQVGYPTAGENVSFTWDAASGCSYGVGRLCQVSDSAGATTFAYDAWGHLIQETRNEAGASYVTAYAYDAADRLSTTTTPTGENVSLSRNSAGQVAQISAALGATSTALAQNLQYDGAGQVVTQTLGNGVTQSTRFDLSGQSSGQTTIASPGPQAALDGDVPTLPEWGAILMAGLLLTITYRKKLNLERLRLLAGLGLSVLLLQGLPFTAWADNATRQYDAAGNIQQRTTPLGATTYTYDALNRLINEAGPAKTQSFSYDPNGNRLSDGLGSYTYPTGSNQLQTRRGAAVTTDAAGHITADGSGRNYVYNQAGRLSQVLQGTTLLATYYYNYKGQRTRKVTTNAAPQGAQTVVYHYDLQGHLMAETSGSGSRLRTYVWREDTPVAQIEYLPSRKILYYDVDHLNTPREARDEAAKVVWRWESDAFGSTYPNEDPDGDGQRVTVNLRFAGQYYDQETALHQNYFRDYDSSAGRYVQSDPIGLAGGSFSTYSYANQNPLSFSDALGLEPFGRGNSTTGPRIPGPPTDVFFPGTAANNNFVQSVNQIVKAVKEACSPKDKDEECYEKCKHLLPSPSGDLQSSEYRKCYRECKGSL